MIGTNSKTDRHVTRRATPNWRERERERGGRRGERRLTSRAQQTATEAAALFHLLCPRDRARVRVLFRLPCLRVCGSVGIVWCATVCVYVCVCVCSRFQCVCVCTNTNINTQIIITNTEFLPPPHFHTNTHILTHHTTLIAHKRAGLRCANNRQNSAPVYIAVCVCMCVCAIRIPTASYRAQVTRKSAGDGLRHTHTHIQTRMLCTKYDECEHLVCERVYTPHMWSLLLVQRAASI